jgi:hypothetical protein
MTGFDDPGRRRWPIVVAAVDEPVVQPENPDVSRL